jgi:PsbP
LRAKFQVSVNGSITGNSSNIDGESFLTFEPRRAGIRIQYPSGLNKQVEQNEVTFSPPEDKYGGKKSLNVWVAVDKTNKNVLDEYVQERIKSIQNKYGYVKFLESSNRVTLSGRSAYKLVYVGRSSDNRSLVKRMEVGTVVDRMFYVVNVGSQTKYYSEILPTFQRMISSFELIGLDTQSKL